MVISHSPDEQVSADFIRLLLRALNCTTPANPPKPLDMSRFPTKTVACPKRRGGFQPLA
jgi:hypothetical protein